MASILCFFSAVTMVAMLQHFILTLPHLPIDDGRFTDGLVVATGGQARIEQGLSLLSQGRANRMLVTGVGQGISRTSLNRSLSLTSEQEQALNCCVDLDFLARDTIGNAQAAKRWAVANGLNSLRLVTANYHLPRARIEFQRALPEIHLFVFAVAPPDLKISRWYRHWPTAKLLSREFGKYLVSLLRL